MRDRDRVEFLKEKFADAVVTGDLDVERASFYRAVEAWADHWEYEVGGMGIHDLRERLTSAGLIAPRRSYVCTNPDHAACTGCDIASTTSSRAGDTQ